MNGARGRGRTVRGAPQRIPAPKRPTREYHVGDTDYSGHSPDEPMIHGFENAGDTPIRFTTVELPD